MTKRKALRFNRQLTTTLLMCALVVLLIDVFVRLWVSSQHIAEQSADIQTPSMLVAKTQKIAKYKGIKHIILGDSVVFGGAMRANGNEQWQSQTLASQLQSLLTENNKYSGRVFDVSMNGALPADLEIITRELIKLHPGAIIFDIGLRSFSKDFSNAQALYSRSWLNQDFQLNDNGGMAFPCTFRLDAFVHRMVSNYWKAYQIRDLLWWQHLGGEPKMAILKFRNFLEGKKTHPQGTSERDVERAEMLLLLKARKRYSTISLNDENLQVLALKRMLRNLREAGQRTIIFYATENPRLLPSLIDPRDFRKKLIILREIIEREGGSTISFLGPNKNLEADLKGHMFLDHVHVDAHGYGFYAKALANSLTSN